MKFLLTGSKGFIGSNLRQYLDKHNHDHVAITKEELLDSNVLANLFKTFEPDYIIHMAAYGNHSSQTDEKATLSANILKLYNLLDASKDVPYKAFINFSTSSCQLPVQTMYSATKAAGEFLCRAHGQKYNKSIFSVRPASVFGEGEDESRFIPTIVRHMHEKTTMKLDPYAKHSWIYVADFIHSLMHLVTVTDKIETGEAINISYGKQWSNLEITEYLQDMSLYNLKYEEVKPMRSYDSGSWLVNNDRLKSLGCDFPHGLQKGLMQTHNYYAGYTQ